MPTESDFRGEVARLQAIVRQRDAQIRTLRRQIEERDGQIAAVTAERDYFSHLLSDRDNLTATDLELLRKHAVAPPAKRKRA